MAYRMAYPEVSVADARKEVTTLESGIFNEASSREEYDSLCEELNQSFFNLARQRSPISPSTDSDEPFSPTGEKIGVYENATHHRNGLASHVFKARAPDNDALTGAPPGSVVALKITVPSMMSPPHNSEREVRILQRAASQNVIPLYETFQQAGGRLILVMPFMPHDLSEVLSEGQLSAKDARCILRGLFEALEHLHSLNIIHRDVKPSNLLLKSPSGPAYLADFGIAWMEGDPASEPANEKITDVGTTSYRPPELLFGNTSYGTSLDLWAAGCVVAEVVGMTGQPLFDAGDLGSELALIKSIFESLGTPNLEVWPEAANFPDWGKMQFYEYPRKSWDDLLPKATDTERDLVSRLVVYESGQRIKADDVLQHKYFKEE